MKIGVTGATGFVGNAICRWLNDAGLESYPIVRNEHGLKQEIVIGDLASDAMSEINLPRLDAIIHLAARAHVMKDDTVDALSEYRKTNVLGTRRIAEAAKRAGIPKFIFLSSIKVNGEFTTSDQLFTETDTPRPEDAYGQSKLEAEEIVKNIYWAEEDHWTIVRAPLIYGPGVRGNFRLILKLASYGVPLPFGRIHNHRSMIYVENLADFLMCTLTADQATKQLFLISDDTDLSTGEIVKNIAMRTGRAVVLLPVPVSWLKIVAKLTGRTAIVDRLVGSLQIDSSKARRTLGWSPKYDVNEAFLQTVQNNARL